LQKKFQLWESQLAILHCSDHNDPNLVRKIWGKIIEQELKSDKIAPLREKVKSLGQEYFPSELVFPLGYLLDTLEQRSFVLRDIALDWDLEWVINVMKKDIQVSTLVMFDLYNFYFDAKDSFWQAVHAQFHLLCVIYRLLSTWIDFIYSSYASPYDIKQFETRRIDVALDKYISALLPYKTQETETLTNSFKNLKQKVNK